MYAFKFCPIVRVIRLRALITGFDVVRPKGYHFSGEMHNFWEAVCVAEGTATATADGRVYTLKSGDLLFHKPMEFHRIAAAEDKPVRLLILSFDADGEIMERFKNGLFKLDRFKLYRFSTLCRRAERVIHAEKSENEEKYAFESSRTAADFEQFMLDIIKDRSSETHEDARYADVYREIVGFMESHCNESMTVSAIAKGCNLSESNLKRIFKIFCDRGVIEYHNFLRIRKAMEMLEKGTTAAVISDTLGFSDVSYFYVAFKRETGLTPRGYVRSLQKTSNASFENSL